MRTPDMELQERRNEQNANQACQAELLIALKKNDLEGFTRLLPFTNVNHFYDAPDFGTCLYISVIKNLPDFTNVLIQNGADINEFNTVRKNTPLHAACMEGNPEMVRLLLDKNANISALDDFGRQALHSAAIGRGKEYNERHLACLKILLDFGSNINAQDRSGATALRLSLSRNHKHAAQMLLSYGANPDADSSSGKSVRELIKEKMPDAYDRLPHPGVYKLADEDDVEKLLFRYMYQNNLKEFCHMLQVAANRGVEIGRIYEGKYTLLQYTCEHEDRSEFITELLKIPTVNPNVTCPGTTWKPILLASYQGNHNALRILLAHEMTDITVTDDGPRKENALHKVARMEKACGNNRSYIKCLDLLIEAIKKGNYKDPPPPIQKRLNINAVDASGNTALHYAARNLEGGRKQAEEMVSALLRAGSYVGTRNKMGEPAISRITPSLLENYLDECVGTNGEAPCEDGYEITFDYTMLVPPCQTHTEYEPTEDDETLSVIKETEPLRYLCNTKEHQKLLKHPVITSFLHLKWHRIRWIFWANLAFYVVFVTLLTAYILGIYGTDPSNENTQESSSMQWTDLCSAAVLFLLAILALRELFQFIISPITYVKSLENMLEVILICTTVLMFLFEGKIKQHMAAVVILLLWIELVLLVGRHPKLSTYITMFTTVSMNFLTFLLWYSLLIVAFALSFFVLFRQSGQSDGIEDKNNVKDDEEEKDFFADPGRALLKTAVMLTGELEFTDLPLDTFRITSHLVFLLFLFLIAVVLLNLLNGLAVSDTQAVKDKAELVGYLSRVALVSHVETMILGKRLRFLNKLSQCFGKKSEYRTKVPGDANEIRSGLGRNILIFPELNNVQVLVNRGRKIMPRCCSKRYRCSQGCIMDHRVIQAARNIIARKSERTEMDEIKQRLDCIEELMKDMATTLHILTSKTNGEV